ncbi:lipase family alpha/beta hydrolase [Pseudonocardia sp. GCM10023141]|uniref:lipase family alpha/beta hydrolase n=1 Tax=Pseudonocardia sp. GCM10023141 TaxID=3252653 RepID=UPI003615F7BA
MASVTESSEVVATAALVTDVLDRVAATTHRMHSAIARSGWNRLLPRSVRVLQESVTTGIYELVRLGIRAVGGVAGVALGSAPRTRTARPWSGGPRGRHLAGLLDGAFGDRLAEHHPALVGPMRIRVDGVDVDPEPATLAARFPDAAASLVVFLHGVIETEEWWTGATPGGDFASRLRADLGCTSVLLRYNSGRHVSDNGRDLADLLDALVAAWPRPVERLALVGHSMGGLVARSAVHQAAMRGSAWPDRTHHLVCLGTPLLGAPLERGANTAAWALRQFDETAPLAALLAARSAGIKDLRHGSLQRDDWHGVDPDAVTRAGTALPYLPPGNVQHSNLAATVIRDPGPLGHWIGDLLVPSSSALAPAPSARTHRIGGLRHGGLLTDDAVYARLLAWLST